MYVYIVPKIYLKKKRITSKSHEKRFDCILIFIFINQTKYNLYNRFHPDLMKYLLYYNGSNNTNIIFSDFWSITYIPSNDDDDNLPVTILNHEKPKLTSNLFLFL